MKEFILNIYFLLRLPAILLLRALIRPRAKQGSVPSRILIVRLDRMGDLVLSVPFIQSLKAACPQAKIDILVRPYLAGLAAIIAPVNEIKVYGGILDAAKRLPGCKYDVVVDMYLGYPLLPAAVALSSRSPVRVGFKGGFREILFTQSVDAGKLPGKGMAEIDLELLKPLGVSPLAPLPRPGRAAGAGPKPLTIAIHPGGNFPSQRWPAVKFAAVAKELSRKLGAAIVVVGAESDRSSINTIMAALKGLPARAAFPEIEELADILGSASLVICNNSGPLHLASALGVPTVSVMGPTDPILWWPRGEHQEVIRKDPGCSPCSRARCGHHTCLEGIGPDEVIAKAVKLIDDVYGIKAA